MTTTIRIRYQDDDGAEFFYRGHWYWIYKERVGMYNVLKEFVRYHSIYSCGYLYELEAPTVQAAIREVVTMLDEYSLGLPNIVKARR